MARDIEMQRDKPSVTLPDRTGVVPLSGIEGAGVQPPPQQVLDSKIGLNS